MFACHKFCKTVGNGISVFYAFNIVCVFLITDVAVNSIGVIVFVNAYKIHKVISELGLDDFNISCFARGVKAPIFKFLNHLAFCNVGIKTAV